MVHSSANDVNPGRLEHSPECGRVMAIDLGAKRVGVAVSDELGLTIRPVETIERQNWKDLLRRITHYVEEFEARALVVGLPLNLDGSDGPAALAARQMAAKFQMSLKIPVYLQDERLTTEEAKSRLRDIQGLERGAGVDGAAAAIILEDFLAQQQAGAKAD